MEQSNCDCQVDTRCYPENPQKVLQKLVDLMYNPISANHFDRHVMLLNDFLNSTTYAFWLCDLPFIIKLLETLFERVRHYCLLEKPLETLLGICSMPPILTKTSDIIEFARDLDEYFSFLGYSLIRVRDVKLKHLILNAIENLLDRKFPTASNCVTVKACHNSVEHGELPNVASKLMQFADSDLYEKLLNICWLLVKVSVPVCHKMVNENIIDYILIRLFGENDNRDNLPTHYKITCKILWKLLKSCSHKINGFKRSKTGPSTVALRSLRDLLRIVTKTKDQINRNYVMAIILQCVDLFPQLSLIESGLASDIGILCAATEISTGGTWVSQVSFGTSTYDYEFKKMLILAVSYCAKNLHTLEILHPKRIIPSLLRIISPELTKQWHPQQLEKLMSYALSALQILVNTLCVDFIQANGIIRLLMMIDYYYIEPYEPLILLDGLKAVYSITSTSNPDLLDNILNNGGQPTIINVCEKLLTESNLTTVFQECLTYSFATLEKIYSAEEDTECKAVNLCIIFLTRVLNPNSEDTLHNPYFLICGLDFLWTSIVWKENSLYLFTTRGGVYMLLDVIYKHSFPVKLIGLGVLVDICDIGLCTPHLITWRKNGQKLIPMILDIFRQENIRIGVKLTYDGMISDVELPLMGQQQWYETYHIQKDPNSSPATIDLLGSCRPKVYAIINLLNNRHQLQVEISNDHYKLFDMSTLSTLDKITLLLAENFLALKLGEAWVEVSQDIEKSGIMPLAIDEEFIVYLKRRFRKWAQHIRISQEKLLEKHLIKEYNKEMTLYNTLRESKLVEALSALHDLDYIARTTEKMFRYASKNKQRLEIDRTETKLRDETYHTTYLYSLKVTPILQQRISIQSDIMSIPNESEPVLLLSDSEDLNEESSMEYADEQLNL
ncbi:hypothetical protein FQA39_LY05166 [Lamprigera yunnana]|nr:hypothetical protein FQA39_LY05166 [Lamprigera yunnana]